MADARRNQEVLKTIYEAWGQGNAEPFFGAITADIHFEEHGSDAFSWAGVWRGEAGVRDFLTAITTELAHDSWQCSGMIGAENTVAAWGVVKTKCRKTGALVEAEWMHRLVFDDEGRIAEFHEFFDSLGLARQLGRVAP